MPKHGILPLSAPMYSVNPTHTVISIKQSPMLKGHLFLVLSCKISYELNLFKVICKTNIVEFFD